MGSHFEIDNEKDNTRLGPWVELGPEAFDFVFDPSTHIVSGRPRSREDAARGVSCTAFQLEITVTEYNCAVHSLRVVAAAEPTWDFGDESAKPSCKERAGVSGAEALQTVVLAVPYRAIALRTCDDDSCTFVPYGAGSKVKEARRGTETYFWAASD